jgi:hypothetical protein
VQQPYVPGGVPVTGGLNDQLGGLSRKQGEQQAGTDTGQQG